jgi:hypothetical protein
MVAQGTDCRQSERCPSWFLIYTSEGIRVDSKTRIASEAPASCAEANAVCEEAGCDYRGWDQMRRWNCPVF